MAKSKFFQKHGVRKFDVFSIILFTILVIYILSLVVPFFWAIFTSFKDRSGYMADPLGFPKSWHFDNYITAIEKFVVTVNGTQKIYIETMILNSFIYALGGALLQALSGCIVAYCCAKFSQFKISTVYVTVVVITMGLPIIGNKPSELEMLINLGLYDNIFGALVLKLNFLGVYFLVFHAAFRAIPKDYSEAAYIDGAGNVTVFFKLMLPFVSKTYMTVALIYFINLWNDYQIPLLYLPTNPTLAYGLYKYSMSYDPKISSTPMKMAGCMVLFIPIFTIFCIFQKQLLGNIMMGGVKE